MTRAREESGFVLVTALILMMVMLLGGFALLSVVDTQVRASGVQRERDASFNLAESALGAARFALGREWPSAVPGTAAAQPWSTTRCSDETLDSSAAAQASTALAQQIQALVAAGPAFHGQQGAQPPAWKVNICDDPTRTLSYRDADVLSAGAAGWDQNDTSSAQKKLWVRAQGTVNGRTSTVASLVTLGATGGSGVTRPVTFPTEYAALAGQMTFTTPVSDQVKALELPVNAKAFANTLLQLTSQGVVQNDANGTGLVGLRCTVLTALCLPGASPPVETPLLANSLSGVPEVVTYGSPTVAGSEALDALRSYAAAHASYVASVADGANCISANAPNNSGVNWVVFVEKVGNGDGTCTLSTGSQQMVALVVGSGRVKVTGSGQLHAVVYAADLQAATDHVVREVVTIADQAQVQGAVWADNGGTIGESSPTVSFVNIINSPDLCNLPAVAQVGCAVKRAALLLLSPADQLAQLYVLFAPFGPDYVNTLIKNQISSSGHKSGVIWEQDRINRLNALTITGTYATGSSATLTGTFQQVHPG